MLSRLSIHFVKTYLRLLLCLYIVLIFDMCLHYLIPLKSMHDIIFSRLIYYNEIEHECT